MDSKEQSKVDSEESSHSDLEKKITFSDYPELQAALEKCSLPEEKIRTSLDYMKKSLSQETAPRFKDFWDVRKLCLPLFKENLNPVMRAQLWDEFVELSTEARRLKDILDEQSAFAVEQIDLALKAIEEDVASYNNKLQKTQKADLSPSKTLQEKTELYQKIQQELSFLNTLASRINALRKEILKTNMRIREKNKFFKRMSSMGDRIFPKRKELIKEISSHFIEDVDAFVEKHFPNDDIKGAPFYVLREEIKALQKIAKQFTLNTHAFMHTREKLSICWDRVKKQEKERKKEISAKKHIFEENKQKVEERLESLEKSSSEMNPKEGVHECNEIQKFMRDIELTREDVKELKSKLGEIKSQFIEKIPSKKPEKIQPKRSDHGIKKQIQDLRGKMDSLDLSALLDESEVVESEIQRLTISENEKDLLRKEMIPVRDEIASRKEKEIYEKPDEEVSSLEKLRSILELRREKRQAIKKALETHRKKLGGSGFDFNMALSYQEMIDREKESLEQADKDIQEIEEKIAELES